MVSRPIVAQASFLDEASKTIKATTCREDQTRSLISYLCGSHTYPLFLFGPPSTGKTLVIERALALFPTIPTAHLDCIELCNDRLILKTALRTLSSHFNNTEINDDGTEYNLIPPTATFSSFIPSFASLPQDSIIIFDRAERLVTSNFSPHFLDIILRLGELTGRTKVILVSTKPFHSISPEYPVDTIEPLQLHFPDYTLKQVLNILVQKYVETHDDIEEAEQTRYKGFAKMVLEICMEVTPNLKELERMVRLSYKHYLEPLQGNGNLSSVELYHRFQPHLEKITSYLYNRSPTLDSHKSRQATKRGGGARNSPDGPAALALPKTARCLLVAVYLASQNPPSQDLRHFTKTRTRKRRRKNTRHVPRENDDVDERDYRSFTIERLFAIYRAICHGGDDDDGSGEKNGITMGVMSAVGDLVRIGYVEKEGSVFEGRYRCDRGMSALDAGKIARSVGIELEGFLHQG